MNIGEKEAGAINFLSRDYGTLLQPIGSSGNASSNRANDELFC